MWKRSSDSSSATNRLRAADEEALLRTPARIEVLVGALETRTTDAAWLSPAQAAALKAHPNAAVRARAKRALGP